MTKEEFAQKIKLQFPEYKEVSDDVLAEKVLQAHPIYRTQIDEKSTLRKIGDFFTSSAQEFGKTLGTAASVIDPETQRLRDETLKSTNDAINNFMQKAKAEEDKNVAKNYLLAAQRLSKIDDIDIFNNPEYQKTAKQIIGEGLGTGLEVATFGTIGAASKIPTIAKPILSPAKKTLQGVKQGAAIGGGFGAAFGTAEALKKDMSISDIAKQTATSGAIGGAGGALLGGAVSGAIQGARSIISRAAKLEPIIQRKVGKVVYNKLNQVSRDILKMSPTAAKNESKWNKNTPNFLVDEGIITLVESDGKKLSTETARNALKIKYNAEEQAFNQVLQDSGEYISLNKLKQQAINNLSDLKNKGSDYEKAIKQVSNEIESYKKNYRNKAIKQDDDLLIQASDFNDIKRGLWQKTSNFNPTQQDKLISDVNYRMGQTAKDLIEITVADAGIKNMNSRLGNFASAMKVLENAEGKVVPGGFFGKQFTRLAGTIAGSGGGIPGSIIGNLTGGLLADLMTNPQIKTQTLSKLLKALEKSPETKTIIDEANEILLKRGEERAARKLLETPKTIIMEEKTGSAIEKELTDSEIQVLEAAIGIGREPKTGKFFKYFKGTPKE